MKETMTEMSISLTIQLGKVHLLSYKPQALGMRQQDARVDGLGPSTDGAAQGSWWGRPAPVQSCPRTVCPIHAIPINAPGQPGKEVPVR